MKKILCLILVLALSLAVLCGCGTDNTDPQNTDPQNTEPQGTQPEGTQPEDTQPEDTQPEDTKPEETEPAGETMPTPVEVWDIDYDSYCGEWGGEWVLTSVYAEGELYTAVENALTVKLTLEEDPSELVDGPAYIHNRVYNLTANIYFHLDSITSILEAEDIEYYKGTSSWEDFYRGKVVAEGQWYEQPGAAVIRYKDIDEYGLFLDEIAGVTADIDTTNKGMVIAMNGEGQLLIGYTENHIERPNVGGEWEYLLILDKAA